jgi:UDP-N-acetylmuramoyl-L-alanyl-D-glutamate--2,6-diaminopimelate ligase
MLSDAWRKPGVPKVSVLNVDDRSFPHLRPIPADVKVTYGLEGEADVTASDIRTEGQTQVFILRAPGRAFEVRSSLLGRHNVYNALAASAAALALDIPVRAVQEGIAVLHGVTGRAERIDEGQRFAAIVDFAHTPYALQCALEALRAETTGRLIVVFGCAGERDVAKRAMMGEVAGRLADVAILTAEDPRSEDLDRIIDQIAEGCESAGAREGSGYYRVPDRARAIAMAVHLAQEGDTVVAAGKGHEQSMCFGTTEYPWDDRVAMRAALQARLGKPVEVPAPRLPTSE